LSQEIIDRIKQLKEELHAVIVSHNYQRAEVQDIADYVGDSLGLARKAAGTDAKVIVFCGVHFMAESAAIVNPDKTVLLPDMRAGCPMADMVTVEELIGFKRLHPGAPVVAYINTSAAVKAESDICCTSANAVKIVNLQEADEIIFIPDKNLAHWVSRHTSKKIIPWNGWCVTHERLKLEEVKACAQAHPEAEILAHPECRPEVVDIAHQVLSTSGMIRYAKESSSREFIICTEMGILHRLEVENPGKVFYSPSKLLVCPNMKLTTLEKVVMAMEKRQHVITVPEDIRLKAKAALDKMLAVV